MRAIVASASTGRRAASVSPGFLPLTTITSPRQQDACWGVDRSLISNSGHSAPADDPAKFQATVNSFLALGLPAQLGAKRSVLVGTTMAALWTKIESVVLIR